MWCVVPRSTHARRAGVDCDAATFEVTFLFAPKVSSLSIVVRLLWMSNGLRFCRAAGLVIGISHVSPLFEVTFRVYSINFSGRNCSFVDYLRSKLGTFSMTTIFSTNFRIFCLIFTASSDHLECQSNYDIQYRTISIVLFHTLRTSCRCFWKNAL